MGSGALQCVECSVSAPAGARGWQGHLVDLDDDAEDEVVFYCSNCADREFSQQSDAADA